MDAAQVERDLATYYDQEAEDRANRAVMPERAAARAAFIAAHVQDGVRVLEVGTGTGQDAAAFAGAGAAVYGADLSHEFARYAARTGAQMVNATVRALPFRDASFDMAWSMSTLMHVPDAAIGPALGELARVLRPGGRAAIGVWGGADKEELLPNKFDPPRYFCRRSDARWQDMLTTIGAVRTFETWHREGEDFYYQWAVISRS